MSEYSEHLISMAGGDGDVLAEIEARRWNVGCSAHSDCLRADVSELLALVREQAATIKDQQARLDRVIELAHWAGKRGWTVDAAAIRNAMEAS